MPDFNLANPAVREIQKDNLYWMDKGVDDFASTPRPCVQRREARHRRGSQSQGVAFWKSSSAHPSGKSEAYTVGGMGFHWDQAVTCRASARPFADLGTIVDMIRTGDGGRNNLANTLFADYETYREFNPDYVDAPFLTNHDQNRISGMLKGDPAQLKLSASLYLFAEGVPFIYYGEEIGLMGAKPDEQIRTPMLWNDPGKDRLQTSWIESKYNRNTIPVARQNRDKLHYYRRGAYENPPPSIAAAFRPSIREYLRSFPGKCRTRRRQPSSWRSSESLLCPTVRRNTLVFATYAETGRIRTERSLFRLGAARYC